MAPIQQIQASQVYAITSDDIIANVKATWVNPNDILSLLLILGGDVISRAIAQQAGSRFLVTPVVFSFGWVAYAFSALLIVVGNNCFMPVPDYTAIIVNTASGYSRTNNNWLLGRLLRDFEGRWMHDEARTKLKKMLEGVRQKQDVQRAQELQAEINTQMARLSEKDIEAQSQDIKGLASRTLSSGSTIKPLRRQTTTLTTGTGSNRKVRAGLCISFYDAVEREMTGTRKHDLYWWSGFVIAFLQIGVAAISWGIYGDWLTFLVVAAGTLLAFATSTLPQWQRERLSCRQQTKKTVAITRGNGAQHVVVVRGCGNGLDFEDLAGSGEPDLASIWMKLAHGFLLICWIVLLLLVSAINNDTWCLLLIGSVGMVHTVVIAGASRDPSVFGVYLKYTGVIVEPKVGMALREAEKQQAGLGVSLGKIFLPDEDITKPSKYYNDLGEKI